MHSLTKISDKHIKCEIRVCFKREFWCFSKCIQLLALFITLDEKISEWVFYKQFQRYLHFSHPKKGGFVDLSIRGAIYKLLRGLPLTGDQPIWIPSTTPKIGLSPHVSPLFCPQEADFVIFMQFLAFFFILPPNPPPPPPNTHTHKSSTFGKPWRVA